MPREGGGRRGEGGRSQLAPAAGLPWRTLLLVEESRERVVLHLLLNLPNTTNTQSSVHCLLVCLFVCCELTDSCAASIMGSCISWYMRARALNPPGMLYKQTHTQLLSQSVTHSASQSLTQPVSHSLSQCCCIVKLKQTTHTHLNVGELPVLGAHHLSHGCRVAGHLHRLPHQLRIVQHVSELRVTLGGGGGRSSRSHLHPPSHIHSPTSMSCCI